MPILVITLTMLFVNLLIYIGNGMTIIDLILNYVKYLLLTFILPPISAVFLRY
jgi:hypothetical protein